MNKVVNKLIYNKYTVSLTPFYKKYPFQGKASIRSADDRGAIDFDLGIFCNRIPKAANSTIVSNLVQLKLGEEIASPQAKKVFTTPSQLKTAELEKFDDLFKFAVVRDPFSRTLSAYLDKIDRKFNQNEEKISFKDFLKSLKAGKLHSNLHWAPQTSILLIPIEEFDFIGKFENLNDDLAFIINKIKGQESTNNDFSRKGPPSTSATDKVKKYYDSECVELMQQMYSKDFELLGYNNTIG
ncbi:sulfotransferase family protein [Thalassomonas sp. M1454]|uniref:sulfotransferase family protein n=1 Tax=Thalassomonas sp. M1454 TaxID=2594477 RepID=UPI00163D8FD7|nr:sulfotransferase family protein [Thalassomonas sp. M1454]